MTSNERLREALRKKGIGPKGSKKLPANIMSDALSQLNKKETNRVTAAAFWTACLSLENSKEEQALIQPVKEHPENYLLPELQMFINPPSSSSDNDLFSIVREVIKGKSLNREKAKQAMDEFWKAQTPSWLQASFLQAMRLKRETILENLVFLRSMEEKTQRIDVHFPCLFDLCDNYDGTTRSYHLTPFVASILAACGYPAYVHGTDSLAPKYGITTHSILKHIGKRTSFTLEEAKNALSRKEIGWCFLDQAIYAPAIYALKKLRHDLVKRPFLATFEKLLQPIRNRNGNIIITGYVHSGYRENMVKIMTLHNQCEQFFNLRSIEGSTNCWLSKPTSFLGYKTNSDTSSLTTPDHNINDSYLEQPLENIVRKSAKELVATELDPLHFEVADTNHHLFPGITVEEIVREGIAALQGKEGIAHKLLIYHSAGFLWISGKISDPKVAVEKVYSTIHSGKAWQHWKALE